MINMKVEDHLEGASNFIFRKSRVLLENDLLQFVNAKVPEPKAEEDHHHKKQKNEDRIEFFFISTLLGIFPTTSDT